MVKKNISKITNAFADVVDWKKMDLFLFLARGGALKDGAKLIGMSYKHVRDIALVWESQDLIYHQVWGSYIATAKGELMVYNIQEFENSMVEDGLWQRRKR
jgi:hypothetical protein